ncbi:MAG: hypothetical protein ACPW60_04060 [Methylohalobius sp. ZOD2]|uniref:hypothetical protein n=1 Tax=Methylohalobius crimeensis TaxID=244365 RepID=UPI0003B732A1|nr:hypothetical protein [Methylohalobius crimeensis]
MNRRIQTLIRSFQGYAYEVAGMITAYFDDPDQARACADRISAEWRKPVEVSGTSLIVVL